MTMRSAYRERRPDHSQREPNAGSVRRRQADTRLRAAIDAVFGYWKQALSVRSASEERRIVDSRQHGGGQSLLERHCPQELRAAGTMRNDPRLWSECRNLQRLGCRRE